MKKILIGLGLVCVICGYLFAQDKEPKKKYDLGTLMKQGKDGETEMTVNKNDTFIISSPVTRSGRVYKVTVSGRAVKHLKTTTERGQTRFDEFKAVSLGKAIIEFTWAGRIMPEWRCTKVKVIVVEQNKSGEEKEISPELKAKIEELIKQLGDDDWQTREVAHKALEKIVGKTGEQPVLLILAKVLGDKDPEIRSRVQRLLEPFPLWLLFNQAREKGIKLMGETKYQSPDDKEYQVSISLKELPQNRGYLIESKNPKNVIKAYFTPEFIISKISLSKVTAGKLEEIAVGKVEKSDEIRKELAEKSKAELNQIELWYGKIEGNLTYENKETGGEGHYLFSKKLLPLEGVHLVPRLMAVSKEITKCEFALFPFTGGRGHIGDVVFKGEFTKTGKKEIVWKGSKYQTHEIVLKMTIPGFPETEENPKGITFWVTDEGKILKTDGEETLMLSEE